ncbi:MAG TPA: 3-deoxy-D-manno-octulosonic acid kinase [Burkholderiales bacterium]|nr:3-deoxy-D-manno-octulosonic acid kinase [Burkholderiales bacterium]
MPAAGDKLDAGTQRLSGGAINRDYGADATRILREGNCTIIFDAAAGAVAQLQWFEPAWWQAQGRAVPADTGRGTTWFVGAPGAQWVLRHYWRGGRVARWIADHYLWLGIERTRPFVEFRLTQRARALGLPVPRPVAARVLRAGVTYSGDLITERLPAVPCSSLMAKGAFDAAGWRAAGACVARCHGAGLDHADLTWNNLLFGRDGTAHLIDLDRAVLRAPGRWALANLARLQRSLDKLTPEWTAADRDAGWREFMAGYSAR